MKKLLVEVKIPDVISPADITSIIEKVLKAVPIEKYGDHVIVISGRMPVWLYSALTHAFHPTAGVATYDPRLQGGVVVMTHTKGVRVGDVISVADAEKVVVDATALEKEKVTA